MCRVIKFALSRPLNTNSHTMFPEHSAGSSIFTPILYGQCDG